MPVETEGVGQLVAFRDEMKALAAKTKNPNLTKIKDFNGLDAGDMKIWDNFKTNILSQFDAGLVEDDEKANKVLMLAQGFLAAIGISDRDGVGSAQHKDDHQLFRGYLRTGILGAIISTLSMWSILSQEDREDLMKQSLKKLKFETEP